MFTESNTVQYYLTQQLAGLVWQVVAGKNLSRTIRDVFLPDDLREALLRLNPTIAAQTARADEVLQRLHTILLSVQGDGLVRANQAFSAWLRGNKTMPFGENQEHVPIHLIDFENPANNTYIAATEVTYKPARVEGRFDLVLYVNGIPLVVGETKTPVREAISWFDGAADLQHYETALPAFFVPNVLSFASEGKRFRYGAVRMPLDLWGPWRDEESPDEPEGLAEVGAAARGLLAPSAVLEMLDGFTAYVADKSGRLSKVIARYQQVHAVNKLVERVVAGQPRKGLIWHFQGSGKSLLMLFAARRLRAHLALRNPTVLVVVDRIDLDSQISGTFLNADVENVVTTEDRAELQRLLAAGTRKILITTIHKFAEAGGVLNDRDNLIVLVDEAHRTQEGELGRQMRAALPNAFLFGLTGTPINTRDHNTFYAFGAEEDDRGYLDRYSMADSLRDGATLPIKFEPRLVELHVNQDAIDAAYAEMTGGLSPADQAALAKMAAKMEVLIKSPARVQRIADDVVAHFRERIAPNGFKAMVVAYDREACLLYKHALDDLLPPETSDVVMTVSKSEPEYQPYDRTRDEEERLLNRFRDPADPLQILIVTAKLLTGFDAPILQTMYLDRPLKDHTLLQAICRVNRVFARPPDEASKDFGLIVDYVGVFDDVARSLRFDEAEIRHVVQDIRAFREEFGPAIDACLAFFPGVDRTQTGYEGLIAAQECLPDASTRDAFAAAFSRLARLWEALSPDALLTPHEADYRWLSLVYESVKPSSGQGRLLWFALGGKTLDLIHENIEVLEVRDDLDTLVMDEAFLTGLLERPDPKRVREVEIKLVTRLQRHADDPRFVALGERLEQLRLRQEQGLLTSIEFLKGLLAIAREVVAAERGLEPPPPPEEKGQAALSELFREVRTASTPKIVEHIVAEIDEIVRKVRFPGWQQTNQGTREVKQALRKTLARYQLHRENDLFEKAYSYIAEYY